MAKHGPFWAIYQDLKAGNITRRDFIARATALGVGLPVTAFILNSIKLDGAAAQDVSLSERPALGTENQTRGAGGELRMLQWQAPTIALSHRGQGTKDILAASLVLEPLLSYAQDGTLIPTLAAEVPTVENGGLSEDLLSVTINLKEGLLWSDGEPVTADDVVFTWQWITNEANSATSFTTWSAIESMEAVTDTQVSITFKEPTLAWYVPLAGANYGAIIPKHVLDVEDGEAAANAFLTNPIGTGPYKVETFKENDQIIYVINENYREPNKPYFATVNLKGGGDAQSAAQAVLQTGDWHFAWNLQVEPEILLQMQEEGGKGTVQASLANNSERLMFNFADPNVEVDGERAHLSTPNPRTTDLAVRQALALGVDRESIANQLYLGGDLEPPGRNFLTGFPQYESPNTTTEFNIEAGIALLEENGWVMDGDVRAKDGVELKFTYYTSINSVRQKTQQIVKAAWEQMGIQVQLGQVDSGVFFASAPGNDQTYNHNYRDIQMYTSTIESPYPLTWMQSQYAGPDNSNVAQKSNDWSGQNNQRWVNAEYDAMYEELLGATDPERATELFIMMNDIVINEVVLIPQVARAAQKYAVSNELVPENIGASAWESLYWNIANWTAVTQ
jgi:peptide/nickel transport system substrate-binding protein